MKWNVPDHLFGQKFSCVCGKMHDIQIHEFLYAKDAIEQLPAISSRLRIGRRVALLMDSRTRDVAGAEASVTLSREGWQVQDVLVNDRPGGGWPVCDDLTKHELDTEIGEVAWILTVGSGVITDLGKWIVIIIVLQSFVNIASVLGIIPFSGLPLAFFSQGGTAMLVLLVQIGIVLNVSKYSKNFK